MFPTKLSFGWHWGCKYNLSEFSDSLMHRAAAAEMLYVLEPDKKLDAIMLIEDSKNTLAMG